MIQNGFVYIVDNYIIGRFLEVCRILNNISGVVIEIILNHAK